MEDARQSQTDSHDISYGPSTGFTYDPQDTLYWDKQALQNEVDRSFALCNSCRMCFKYCDSFPMLFDLLDNKYDGNVYKISPHETQSIMDQCFQCKLCEVQCPYTPRDQHEFKLDFPKLVHRWQAVAHKERGKTPLGLKVLGNQNRIGKLARSSLGLANAMNKVAVHRWFLEKVLDIDRRKLLPDFASKTFESEAKKRGISFEPGGEAVLFQTCYVQNNEPQIGHDTLDVLEKNQVDCRCGKGLECCGMPAWEHGDLESLKKYAKTNLDVLLPHVDKGAKVLAVNPTCSMMLRREYPELLDGEDRERAHKLSEAVMDPGEFVWSIRKEARFSEDFKTTPNGPVAYHAPCHLRTQAVGFKGRDLLRKLPGVELTTAMECCGHNGTFAMRTIGYETSIKVGQNAFDQMSAPEAKVWVTDCPLAALQFEQHAGVKGMHPMSVLAKAYRGESFPGGATVNPPKDETTQNDPSA